MLSQFLKYHILNQFPFRPNEEQDALLDKLCMFLTDRQTERLFLLNGYAGTGKTSIMAAMVKALHLLQQKTILLAPTGRAAKVLSNYAGFPAYTIHKRIYRQKQLGEDRFGLSFNTQKDTVFIVDEASMISNQAAESAFGSGCLLDDLIRFVFSGENCSLILIGDNAQLPPVGQTNSPALDSDYLSSYGLNITTHTLTQVARQALDSGILWNATRLREQLSNDDVAHFPHFRTEGFSDIFCLTGEEMLEELERAYSEVGAEETIVITRTNKRMNIYNQGIRSRILWKDEQISGNDRIMVTKNNYFWTRQYQGIDFLANGDMFQIERIRNFRELYGFRFADASLRAVDYDWEIDVTIWLDTLSTESPEQNYQMQRTLFERISEDYPEIHSKKELFRKILDNPYYNALQVKHAYAVTCHKAQGGQWERVFIDPGMVAEEQLGTDFYRWCYTAITRGKNKVFLVNFPT